MSPKRTSKSRLLLAILLCLACVLCSNVVVLTVVFRDLQATDLILSLPRRLDSSLHGGVHLVTTRFMQHQPNLLALGHARLELFETFCLRSILHQDTSDFLWLILIDPDLHPEILEKLKHLVSPYSNFFLIRCRTSTVDLPLLNHSLVESGDIRYLARVAQVMSSDVVTIQTRLDADDGLERHVLRTLKHMAVQQLSHKHDDSKGWELYCIHRHFEWHSAVPLANETYANNNPAGNLLLVQKEHCVTPGLTYAFAPGVTQSQIPKVEHQLMGYAIPPCKGENQTACLRRLDEFDEPVSIRARTLTSAGMSDIGRDFEPKVSSLPDFFRYLERRFDISQQSLVTLQSYLNNNSAAIAQDHLDGQCTKGHSCKADSKAQLQKVLAANSSEAWKRDEHAS